jgi:hypothetical protein
LRELACPHYCPCPERVAERAAARRQVNAPDRGMDHLASLLAGP